MIEIHPFGDYVPDNARYLLLGSFIAKKAPNDAQYDWYYSSKRNQFWPILEIVYDRELRDKASKERLLAEKRLAMSDIILQCERRDGNSLDANLINIVYNIEGITTVLRNNAIEKIFFTSRFVEQAFRKLFKDLMLELPQLELITLPSPSPRYARLTKQEKAAIYKELLP
jgi:hypoxanthine-DNA glycosylase